MSVTKADLQKCGTSFIERAPDALHKKSEELEQELEKNEKEEEKQTEKRELVNINVKFIMQLKRRCLN